MGIDNKLSFKNASDVKYFLTDHLGSTNGLVDSVGSLTAQTGYDAFGNPTNVAFPSRYQFTGREFDNFSKLQYSRARFYDPKLGRFISEDPIGFNGGDINLYGYVRNQPLRYRDPMGLNATMADPNVWRLGAAGLAAAGIVAPPLGIAAVGGAAIYVAWDFGDTMARHPSNPLSHPWGYPINPPLTPPITTPPSPSCQPVSRPIPWFRDRTIPFPIDPPSDRDGCAEEISACTQQCAVMGGNPNYPKVGGRNFEDCMQTCISERCGGAPKWKGYKDSPGKRRWKF